MPFGEAKEEIATKAFLANCPNCEFRMTIDPERRDLTILRDNELAFLKFLRDLPAYSETLIKVIKHEGQLRIEVERSVEKIIL